MYTRTCVLDSDGGDGCGWARAHPCLSAHPEVVPEPSRQLTHQLVEAAAAGCPGLYLRGLRLFAPVHRVPAQDDLQRRLAQDFFMMYF